VLRDLNRPRQAAEAFRKAVAAKPEHLAARDNLGSVERQLGRFEASAEAFRGTIGRNPFHMRARVGLAETLQEAGDGDGAIAVFREALTIRPKDAELLHGLGVALMEKGDLAGAAEMARAALAVNPALSKAWLLLSQVKPQKEADAELEEMAGQYGRSQAGSLPRMQFAFGLGKAHDDLKDFGRAFDYFAEGNAIRRAGIAYDGDKTRAEFAAMKATFSKEFLASHPTSEIQDDRPIFVVGMPRSGTTLVEQILASHPRVFGAGEQRAFGDVVNSAIQGGGEPGYPDMVPALSAAQLDALGSAYLSRMTRLVPDDRKFTDKMPANFVFAGLIRLVLPNARMICVSRHALDTCLSIFATNFADPLAYAYDLGELGRYYRAYERLMDHWRHALPKDAMLEVQYEDVIADLEGQARRIVAYCGHEWDETCLAFHKTERPVRTASVEQVRQPIYKTSVARWRAYEKYLGPLTEALGQSAGTH
jgi:tetratricopeptide (TPR) repeat protein